MILLRPEAQTREILRRYDYKRHLKPLYTGLKGVVMTVTALFGSMGLGVAQGEETADPSTALSRISCRDPWL